VLDAGACHLLEVAVSERICNCGAYIFVRQVDAGDAFVVGGESDRHAVFAIEHEGMAVALDVEDHVVAGEIDFDHDMFCRHLF
jgi:hypothetical protein